LHQIFRCLRGYKQSILEKERRTDQLLDQWIGLGQASLVFADFLVRGLIMEALMLVQKMPEGAEKTGLLLFGSKTLIGFCSQREDLPFVIKLANNSLKMIALIKDQVLKNELYRFFAREMVNFGGSKKNDVIMTICAFYPDLQVVYCFIEALLNKCQEDSSLWTTDRKNELYRIIDCLPDSKQRLDMRGIVDLRSQHILSAEEENPEAASKGFDKPFSWTGVGFI
jgi:hypothetical protein